MDNNCVKDTIIMCIQKIRMADIKCTLPFNEQQENIKQKNISL